MPIGISFFTFQAMSYVIDVYRKDSQCQRNPLNLLLYVSFFPQLIAGPIVRYKDIEAQLQSRSVQLASVPRHRAAIIIYKWIRFIVFMI